MEKEMQQLAMEMQFYKQQAEETQGQMRSIAALVQENDAAEKALENLGESESLFSIGSGIFVKAKPSPQKVLVEIGARVMAEKTAEEAKAFLRNRRDELVKAMSKLQNDLEELNSAMAELGQKAQQMQK